MYHKTEQLVVDDMDYMILGMPMSIIKGIETITVFYCICHNVKAMLCPMWVNHRA